ncbi:MbnP family protein [Spirosoma pulveris]
MKWTITASLLATLVLGLAVVSCHETEVAPTGRMRIAFDNVVGTSDLKLSAGTYQNAAGESFSVTKFNYFVSNIRLQKDDGSEFVVPQDSSYFLIQEEKPASQTITLSNIPAGNYTRVTFVVGVDSARSMADISKRTGILDPALNNGMYWDWNSGYIFMKIEGTSAVAPAAQNNAFFYHIGGFGRANVKINNIRTVSLPFAGTAARVEAGSTPTIGLKTDALKIFNGPTKLSIAQNPSVMFELYSTNIADNYAQMFSYDRILANQ